MNECPCGSGLAFADCCEPILSGRLEAPTAERLMRARYSAYVTGNISFLGDSLHPEHRDDWDEEATRKWSERATWSGLRIEAIERGGEQDDEGIVEFRASYRQDGMMMKHHEISRFARKDGKWYYVEGRMPPPSTKRSDAPKVGRNAPCPCGSGLKHKKCCGR